MPTKAWLITGASSGLGLALSLHLLKHGKSVVAATRNPAAARARTPELEQRGGTWLALDPSEPSARGILSTAIAAHSIDVLVNSAAYPLLGALEDVSDDELRAQLETNVVGPHRLATAALPLFRARPRPSATAIVNVSSAAGYWCDAGRGPYVAAKHALSGLSASLAADLAPWGVRVLLVEPGAFRTPFGASRVAPAAAREENGGNGFTTPPYAGSPAHTNNSIVAGYSDSARGDPQRAAQVIADAVDAESWKGGANFMRLPLGSDAVRALDRKIEILKEQLAGVRAVCVSTDFPAGA